MYLKLSQMCTVLLLHACRHLLAGASGPAGHTQGAVGPNTKVKVRSQQHPQHLQHSQHYSSSSSQQPGAKSTSALPPQQHQQRLQQLAELLVQSRQVCAPVWVGCCSIQILMFLLKSLQPRHATPLDFRCECKFYEEQRMSNRTCIPTQMIK
jgi:hypothetical protein